MTAKILQQQNSYFEEYQNTIGRDSSKSVNWDQVAQTLVTKHDWTKEGAAHLAHLVRDYGTFILSHAVALSSVMNQEDGELGL